MNLPADIKKPETATPAPGTAPVHGAPTTPAHKPGEKDGAACHTDKDGKSCSSDKMDLKKAAV